MFLFRVKEDATGALGAGDGVEIAHAAVGRWRRLSQEFGDGARVLHFDVFYLYRRHTTAQGNWGPGERRGMVGGDGVDACATSAM